MDLIRGKGKGLIFLLHGAPGVGKTLTAETIAAYTGRPLYPITCGDIGQTPGEIEDNLEHHFKLAHKWGCVLLLDEADVFLAKRERGDVKRNALVSGELSLHTLNKQVGSDYQLDSISTSSGVLLWHPLPHYQPCRSI